MSSKFFTWTKGDRRNASEALRAGNIVTIPAELRINGLEYARAANGSTKANRKPLTLPLNQDSKESNSSQELALHDAAIKSATSLMAVMNEMLKSPPISAHLAERQRSPSLQPMHGRPRSHTAPSTPVAEAPFTLPAELPGSTPAKLERESSVCLPYQSRHANISTPSLASSTVLGHSIERPRSSPQETIYSFRHENPRSMDAASDSRLRMQPNDSPSTHSHCSVQPLQYSATTSSALSVCDTLVDSVNGEVLKQTPHRPSLSVMQSTPPSNSSSRNASHGELPAHLGKSNSAGPESVPISQLYLFRATHESHIVALREAHEKELASHRTYIDFLESRSSRLIHRSDSRKQNLTLDTTQASTKAVDSTSPASSTTLRSLDSNNTENRSSTGSHSSAEVESLKRKLSLARRAQTETADVRRDRDYHRDLAERSAKRIGQLKDIVKKSKENEKSLKNAVQGLESSLVESNNQRVDVLEGFHEACEKLKSLQLENAEKNIRIQDLEKEIVLLQGRTQPHNDTLDSLQVQGSTSNSQDFDEAQSEIMRLQDMVAKQQTALSETQMERDRYNSLLHTELRRTSRLSAQKAHIATPEISAEAFSHVHETVSAIKSQNHNYPGFETADHTDGLLERELEHCIKEIIMYKLDVKGYKKDLKKAHVRIEQLQSLKEGRSSSSAGLETGGLGITIGDDPSSPTRALRNATSSALIAASPPARASAVAAPAATPRPSTPLNGTHKKLPKPPSDRSRSPSPIPPHLRKRSSNPVQRAETLRSVSESIISSYAHRTTPEQVPNSPIKVHSSTSDLTNGSRRPFRHTAPMTASEKFALPTVRATNGIVA